MISVVDNSHGVILSLSTWTPIRLMTGETLLIFNLLTLMKILYIFNFEFIISFLLLFSFSEEFPHTLNWLCLCKMVLFTTLLCFLYFDLWFGLLLPNQFHRLLLVWWGMIKTYLYMWFSNFFINNHHIASPRFLTTRRYLLCPNFRTVCLNKPIWRQVVWNFNFYLLLRLRLLHGDWFRSLLIVE